MRYHRPLKLLPFLLLLLLIGGCDEAPTGPDGLNPGEGQYTISGDLEQSVRGWAIYETTEFADHDRWMHVVIIAGGDPGHTSPLSFTLLSDSEAIPTGTFDVVELDPAGVSQEGRWAWSAPIQMPDGQSAQGYSAGGTLSLDMDGTGTLTGSYSGPGFAWRNFTSFAPPDYTIQLDAEFKAASISSF